MSALDDDDDDRRERGAPPAREGASPTDDPLVALARAGHHAELRELVRARLRGELGALHEGVDRADAERLVDQLSDMVAGALRIAAADEAADAAVPPGADPEGAALMARVHAALTADGWTTTVAADGISLVTAAACESGDVFCQILWLPEERYLVCYAAIAAAPPAGRTPALFELAARANHHLPAGAFEVDLESGEVRVRSALFVDAGAPSDRQLRELVEVAARTMDAYAPAIRAVYAGAAPLDALEAVEGGTEPPA